MKKIACISMLLGVLLICLTSQSWAFLLDFESGVDLESVGWVTSGVQLITIGGDDLIYADIDEDRAFYSDNGKQNTDWEHYISGDVAVVSPDDNVAQVNFTQSISYFQIGYSSLFPFVIEAYDSSGNLLDQASGDANSKHANGTGLLYLDASSSSGNISYVLLYSDQGDFPEPGWWVIDNLTYEYPTTPVVPEWPCQVLASVGIMLFGCARQFRRSR